MIERDEDRVFEEFRKMPRDGSDAWVAKENDLVHLLEQHAYAVCWEQLRERRGDVVNAAIVRAFQAMGKFRGDSKFSTWFHRIVVNECKRVAVKENLLREREVSLEDVKEPQARDAMGEYFSDKEILALLDVHDRDFFECKEKGWNDFEIGARFNLSPAGVRVRWHRIRKKLQNLLRSTSGARTVDSTPEGGKN